MVTRFRLFDPSRVAVGEERFRVALPSRMIDKLEVRVPAQIQYCREFQELYTEVRRGAKDPFKPSRHYLAVGDLRPYGYEAILHAHCVHGEGNHKLELIDTGRVGYSAMVSEVERVFDVNPRGLNIMRLDVAADIRSVPVSWFLEHLRARYKRWVADVGKIEVSRMGTLEIETFYLGKRPNCFRVYNKIAELKHQYARLKSDEGAPKPPFQEVYGYPATGLVLTRVERQIGGGRVPEGVATVGQLRCLAEYDPFSHLEILAGAARRPNPDDHDPSVYFMGRGLECAIQERGGLQRARGWLNRYTGGNAARLLKTYGAFLPASEFSLSVADIRESYQESVRRQLAA